MIEKIFKSKSKNLIDLSNNILILVEEKDFGLKEVSKIS